MPIINPLPNTIVNGAPLDATPLMANFNAIVSNVNAGAAGLTVANTFSVVQTFNGIYNSGAYVNQTTGVSQSSIFTDAAGNLVIGTGLNATPAYARHNADGSLTLPAGLSATTGAFSSTLNVSGATTLAALSATTGTLSSGLIATTHWLTSDTLGPAIYMDAGPANNIVLRSGSSGGGYKYTTIDSAGTLSTAGTLIANGVVNTPSLNGNWAGNTFLVINAASSGGTIANLSFYKVGVYGLNAGLDSDNAWKIGGFSQGVGVFRLTLDTSGNLVASGNVTAYSDGRDKQDWAPLVGIKQHLLGLKNWGSYTDVRSGERKVGIVAQDFLRLMPEAVLADRSTGRYSFAYGQAAMAALVAYAHDNESDLQTLRNEVAAIKTQLGAQHG